METTTSTPLQSQTHMESKRGCAAEVAAAELSCVDIDPHSAVWNYEDQEQSIASQGRVKRQRRSKRIATDVRLATVAGGSAPGDALGCDGEETQCAWTGDHPDGPRTLDGVLNILSQMAATTVDHMSSVLNRPLQKIEGPGWQRLVITTSYSGMDFPGIAASHLQHHFRELGVEFEFELYAATDIDKACKTALLQKRHAPEHIFDSILDRIPEELKHQLLQEGRHRREEIQQQLSERFPGGELPKTNKKLFLEARQELLVQHTRAHVRRMRILLSAVDMSAYQTGWCWSCQKVCSVLPERQAGRLYLEIAGSTCVAYSTMSLNMWGLLDDSAVPFLVWMMWVRHCRFDLVLHECVPGVPLTVADNLIRTGCEDGSPSSVDSDGVTNGSEALYELLGTVVTSPVNFGVPCHRRRRYSCWRRLAAQDSSASAVGTASTHIPGFNSGSMAEMFYKKLVASSKIFLVADAEQVGRYYKKRAADRSIPPQPLLEVLDLVPACARAHLEAWDAILASGAKETSADIVCVMQSPHFLRPQAIEAMPALLTSSLMYSLSARRLLLPEELMLAMGLHIQLGGNNIPDGDGGAMQTFELPLAERLREYEVRRLLGNGMHVSQVGSALLLLLCEAMRR